MKITVIQLLLAVISFSLCWSAPVKAQLILEKRVNATFDDQRLENVLVSITAKANVKLVYNDQLFKKATNVSASYLNKTLKEVLDEVLLTSNITYEVINDQYIVLKLKPEVKSLPIENFSSPQDTWANDHLVAGFLVSGRIIDENGNALVGVIVKVKNTTHAVTTNDKGMYSIDLTGANTLVFSFVGYTTIERAVNQGGVLNLSMVPTAGTLNEVAIVGYGTVKRRDLTGSVSNVKVEDLQKAPVISFTEALGGRVAGVRVSSADGQPGGNINVVIRGANSVTQNNAPLYVIDGFPLENFDNNALNPAEIESIEVLKDASSTAIYGARGANGVIIITTKKGKIGKPVIAYNGYYGFMADNRKIPLMDGYDFVKYQYERDSVTTNRTYYANGKTAEDYRNVPNTDLQNSIFKKSPFQNHFVSLTGGTENTRYAISLSDLKQEGILLNSGYNRYQGRINIDQTVNPNLKVGINYNYSFLYKYGTSPANGGNGFYYGSLLYSIWAYHPVSATGSTLPIEDQTDDFLALNSFNPITTAENELRRSTSGIQTYNAYAEYTFIPELKLRITGGMTRSVVQTDVFNNSQTASGSPLTITGQNQGVNGSRVFGNQNSYLNENTLTYNKVLNRVHNINVLGGFTLQSTDLYSFGAAANHIPNETLGISGLDEGTPLSIASTSSKYTLASFLGRINYSYDSKYLLTASMRADGSSRFSDGNKWGYFPSGAIAWRIDRESFMKAIPAISEAKIRASYGMTGNNQASDFAYRSTITIPSGLGYSFNNSPVPEGVPTALGNLNLKWETTAQTDLGLNLGFFDQRLSFEADIYRKVTSDLLLNAQLPTSVGFSNSFKNIGKVQNQGLELTLNSVNIKNDKFNWTTNFNISFNRNKVLALTENQNNLLTTASWNTLTASIPLYNAEIGHPIAMFYGYEWDGNYQYSDFDQNTPGVYTLKAGIPSYNSNRALTKPGDIKYKDINGDGVVNTLDRVDIGNPNPTYTGGFSNDFTYKNFDLSVFMEFSEGNQVMNANRIIFEGGGLINQNMYATYLDRWTPTNPSNTYYRAGGAGPADFFYNTRTIEDGSYLRLKTVSLGYTFSQKMLSRAKIKSLRIYASAQNLYTWTKYTGLDPEVSVFGSSALQPGFDYSVYPRARTITFGLNISL